MVRIGPNEHSARAMESKRFALSGGAHHGNAWFASVRMNTRREPWNQNGSHSVAVRTMETPGSHRLKQSFGCGDRNLCCILSVYYVAAEFSYKWYATFQMMKFLGLLERITNIRSRFGLILVTYRSNLQNGKQYSVENLYLI